MKVKDPKGEIDPSRFSTVEGFPTILQSTIAGFYCTLVKALKDKGIAMKRKYRICTYRMLLLIRMP